MTNHIGPRQRAILAALKAGGELHVEHGEWSLHYADGTWHDESRARCMALFERGFIMADTEGGGMWRYRLTGKGERA